MPRVGFAAFAASARAKAAGAEPPAAQESEAPQQAPAAPQVPPAVAAAAAAAVGAGTKGRKLSVEDVKKLLESLRTASMRPDFQKQLKELQQQEWGAFRKRQGFARILASAWKSAIKAAGFGINRQGFPELLAAVRTNQPDVRTLSEEVERQLKFPVGALFGAKAGQMKGTATATATAAAPTTVPRGGAFSSVAETQQAAAPPPPAPEEPPSVRGRGLGMGEAKELLKAFKDIAKQKEVQTTLSNLERQGQAHVSKTLPMLIGQLYGSTMDMFEYPNTPEGYAEMVRGIKKHGWNLHVKTAAHEVERLMHMKMGSWFTIPPDEGEEEAARVLDAASQTKKKLEAGPGEFVLVVRHAVENKEIKVVLPNSATFVDAKEAISKFTGRDDILRKGRLVQKRGGTYSSYRDSDQIAPLKEVLVLGADLSIEGEEEEEEEDEAPPPVVPQHQAQAQPPPPRRQEPPPAPKPPPERVPQLTRDQALRIQGELKHGFAGEVFQQKRRELESAGLKGMKFNAERNKLFMSVQSVVLPRYGFRGDAKGVFDMMKAFEALGDDEEIGKNGWEINILLGLAEPPQAPQPPPPPPQQQPAPPPPEPPAPAPQPPPPPPQPEKPPEEVQVTVEHALEGGSLTVTIMDNATVLELRRLVMAKLNETKISQVKIVSRLGDGYQSVPDDRKIKDKRAFLLIGRSIDLPPEPPAPPAPTTQPAPSPKEKQDMELTVVIDQLLGMQTSLRVTPGTTVGAVKNLLAQADTSGSTSVQDFGLRLPNTEHPLEDAQEVGPGTPELHYCSLVPLEEPPANISGRWRVLDESGVEHYNFVLIHEQNSGIETLKGWQVNGVEIWDGHVRGDEIEWKVGGSHISGKLKDQRWRMRELWARTETGQYLGPFTGEWACTVEEAIAQHQQQQPAGDAAGTGEDIEVVILIDRSLDLKSTITLKSGSTVWHVKEHLASDDPTGNTQPQEFGLMSSDGIELEDKVLITKACELEIVMRG